MTSYNYKISNNHGLLKTGQIEAESEIEVAKKIKQDNFYIISIKPKNILLDFNIKFGSDISVLELITFTDHLASMIGSGTQIIEALEVYQEEKSSKISILVENLIWNIQQGKKISEALAIHPKVFSPLYISLVQTGELTGTLDETLSYLGNELRKEYEFKEKIKSALIYPALVMFMSIAIIILLVFLVIPKITKLTDSLGGELPLSTKIILSGVNIISHFGPLLFILFSAIIIGGIIFLNNTKKKEQIDLLLLKSPFFGPIIKKYNLTRLLRVISSCLHYGIPLTSAFSIVSLVVRNRQYKRACERINERIKKGSSISEAISLENQILFPKIIIRSIKGGEKAGTVDVIMQRLSNFYEAEIDRSLKRIIELIEPLLIIVLGIIVCGIAIAVIAPIYQITTKIK